MLKTDDRGTEGARGCELLYTRCNSRFVYRQRFSKTRHLYLTYIFPITSDDLFLYIAKFVIAAMIKLSCKYLERVLTKCPVIK